VFEEAEEKQGQTKRRKKTMNVEIFWRQIPVPDVPAGPLLNEGLCIQRGGRKETLSTGGAVCLWCVGRQAFNKK